MPVTRGELQLTNKLKCSIVSFCIIIGYCVQIANNTASQAEINSIAIVNGKWHSPLPSLLSAQGGAAFGEVYIVYYND